MTVPRFLIDECLSPELARRLAKRDLDATSVRNRAQLGKTDGSILDYAIKEDRIIVTQNADDFRKLVGRHEVHPGLIILASSSIEKSWHELVLAIEHAEQSSNQNVRDWMLNRVIEVDGDSVTDYQLPPI